MQVVADQGCFICGTDNPIGLNVNFTIDQDNCKAEATLVVSEGYQGWQGVVHGGIISALLDEAAIYACRPKSLYAVTAGLNVRFLKPVSVDIETEVKAEVIAVRRRLATVKSCLWQAGELKAEADVKVLFANNQEE